MKYCNGEHLCQICKKTYKCHGETSLHDGNTSSGRCNGERNQFCPNHDVEEYIQKHKELGEL